MKTLFYFLLRIVELPKAIRSRVQKKLLYKCGDSVYVGYNCDFFYSNISIGNNVHIGNGASFIASIAKIYIGDNVMFGPNVTIRGGDHRIDIVGRSMMSMYIPEVIDPLFRKILTPHSGGH